MDFNGLEQSWWYRNKRPQTAARVLAHCPKAHRTSAGTAVRLLQLVASWSSIQPGLALETSGTNMQLKPPPEILPWGLRWYQGGSILLEGQLLLDPLSQQTLGFLGTTFACLWPACELRVSLHFPSNIY